MEQRFLYLWETSKKEQEDDSEAKDFQGMSKGQMLQVLNSKHPENQKGVREGEWKV